MIFFRHKYFMFQILRITSVFGTICDLDLDLDHREQCCCEWNVRSIILYSLTIDFALHLHFTGVSYLISRRLTSGTSRNPEGIFGKHPNMERNNYKGIPIHTILHLPTVYKVPNENTRTVSFQGYIYI